MRPPSSLIALYHAIGTPEATGYRDALSRDNFARQMDWLQQNYDVFSVATLFERQRGGRALEGLAAITFDDNHRSILDLALPLLAERDLPATWCLIGAPLAGRPYWRRQVALLIERQQVEAFLRFARERDADAVAAIRAERFYRDSKDPRRTSIPRLMTLLGAFAAGDMEADFVRAEDLNARQPPSGLSLANHSFSHPVLAGLSLEEQRAEIEGGRAAIEAVGWQSIDVLALPFGGPGSYDATTLLAAQQSGCQGLLLTAEEDGSADDLSAHPLIESHSPALTRRLLGKYATLA